MKRKNLILILIVFLLIACMPSREKKKSEEVFSSMFPDIPMNSDIAFWETSEEFINGQSMTLTLENMTSFEIRFSDKNDVYAFVFENQKWNRLENSAIYIPADVDAKIRPKGLDSPGVTAVSLNPHLSNAELTSVDVRVVVIGTVYDKGQSAGKKIGAYIDVKLNP